MRLKRFESYVLEEIVPSLLGALVVVIMLLVLVALQEVLAPLLAKGANPILIARLLALNIPWAISQALPLALMFATILGLSRLSTDSEIKSALASGIPASRLFIPVMVLAILISALSFSIGEILVPKAKIESQKVQREIIFDNPRVIGLGGSETSGRRLVLTDSLSRAITVGSLSGGELHNIEIVTMQPSQPPKDVISAKKGKLVKNILEISDGQRITFQNGRPVTIISFKKGRVPVQDVQASFKSDESAKPIDQPIKKLLEITRTARLNHTPAPSEFTALHRKFAEPLAAIALAFFSISLSVYTFRSGVSLGFTWAIILAFAYYATWSVFKVMGENAALPAVIAAYSPDLIAFIAGIILLFLANNK